MKILLMANGSNVNIDDISNFDKIICVDGGLNNLNISIVPDVIIGDFDSVDSEKMDYFQQKSKIIYKNNQDVSDLYFALDYSLKEYNVSEIVIINAISIDRIDHTICNIFLLKKVPKHIKAKIITDNQVIFLVENEMTLNNLLGKTLSIIPLVDCESIYTNGLKWNILNENIPFGFINGISNIITSNIATIRVGKGEVLVVVNRL